MNFQTILDHFELSEDIAHSIGKLQLVWEKRAGAFDLFQFHNRDSNIVSIRDDADYLKLFMEVGAKLFNEIKDKDAIYLCACSLKGEKLLIKEFEQSEREQLKYSYIALSEALKEIPDSDRPKQLNFFSELSYERSDSPRFEKEALKIAKILKGENRTDWQEIIDHKYNFLKTDMYVFTLMKLHSWGFQPVTSGGDADGKLSLIRPVRPIPRGAVREKKKAKK